MGAVRPNGHGSRSSDRWPRDHLRLKPAQRRTVRKRNEYFREGRLRFQQYFVLCCSSFLPSLHAHRGFHHLRSAGHWDPGGNPAAAVFQTMKAKSKGSLVS